MWPHSENQLPSALSLRLHLHKCFMGASLTRLPPPAKERTDGGKEEEIQCMKKSFSLSLYPKDSALDFFFYIYKPYPLYWVFSFMCVFK